MRITADLIDSFTINPFALLSDENDKEEESSDVNDEIPSSSEETLKPETSNKPLSAEDPYFFCAIVGDKVIPVDDELNTRQRQKYVKNCHNIMEMTQGFEKLSLFDQITRPSDEISAIASTSKPMDKTDGDVPTTSQTISPSWLKQYLSKMKQEIKREVVQELLHENEMLSLKAAASSQKMDENQTLFQDVVHSGIFCDNCDQLITGIRYKCGNCSDFDLCQECESLPNIHEKYHIFLKIRYPFALKLYQKQKTMELLNSASPSWKVGSGKLLMTSRNRQSKKLYEAKFVCDETVPDSTVIPPSTKFVKSWRVVNSGTRVWTHATKLQLIQGSPDLVPNSEQVDVPHLKPGEEGVISVVFTSPSTPGVYRCHWNFCHKSRPFGDFVWCHIVVKSQDSEGDDCSEKTKPPCISIDKAGEKQNEASCIEQVLTAVKKEHDRGNMVPRKLVVSSHTATPNNTPFDLSPPKSPDHHETSTIKSIQEITVSTQTKDSDDEDDECSIVSIGSSESDTEFVVIPMPKCFNLSESFVSQHIPLWVNCHDDADNGDAIQTAKPPVPKPDSLQLHTLVKKPVGASETVSQETGVPEFSENICDQILVEHSETQKEGVTTNYISLVNDGSSSEVSIIESEENSPDTECSSQTINLSLSSGNILVEKVVHQNNNIIGDQFEQSEELMETTFPKFPIEGITGTYDPSPASNEESSVQVLPEGLVTGALSAAASVYNTARAVISTIQHPRNEETSLTQDFQSRSANYTLDPMDQLIEMGFSHRELNEKLLKKFNGNVAVVVSELVKMNDNDWYASRHTSPSHHN